MTPGLLWRVMNCLVTWLTKARNQLVAGLSQLRDTARHMATQDATELVQRFGEMGRRKFHLAA